MAKVLNEIFAKKAFTVLIWGGFYEWRRKVEGRNDTNQMNAHTDNTGIVKKDI